MASYIGPQSPPFPPPSPSLFPIFPCSHPTPSCASSQDSADPMLAGSIKFSQINLHHAKAASDLHVRSLTMMHTPISLIQEPYLFRDKVGGLGGMRGSIFCASSSPGPRACIYIDSKLKAIKLNQLCTRDLAVARISLILNGKAVDLVVGSAYLPYDSKEPPPTRELRTLIDYCSVEGLMLIVGCDANSHHTVWGSSNVNSRGTALLEYLSATDLDVLNRGSRPTFVNARRQEVIDVTLCSTGLREFIKGWRVDEEETLSDHRKISFTLTTGLSCKPEEVFRNPKATNWNLYKEVLEGKLEGNGSRLWTVGSIDAAVDRLQKDIIDAYKEACPEKKTTGHKKVAWWSGELQTLRSRTRKLLNKAMSRNSDQDWTAYKAAQKEYKKLIRKSKTDSWRNFCNDTESLPLVARLRKVFSSGPRVVQEGLVRPDGSEAVNHQDILNHLIETHFPGSHTADPRQAEEETQTCLGEADWELAKRVITKDRIRWAIDSFDKYKSPGIDGIFPALLQEGGERMLIHLMNIFRSCLALKYTPLSWRKVRVVFIPKPGKDSYDKAKSFRPISLMSFVLKTMERLVDQYIKETALVNRPISSNQHAYQPGKSVESALHQLVREVEGAMDRGGMIMCVFLDIEGAFDNTPFDAMCQASTGFGVDNSIVDWIGGMLRHRTVVAGLSGTEVEAKVGRGCPQGGVLSPLLWTLVVDGLLTRLAGSGFTVQGYADDVAISVKGDNIYAMSSRMQKALNIVQEWCLTHGLKVNPSKTELVLFTRKRNTNLVTPTLFGVQLQRSDKVRYLGVTLDSKLLWYEHFSRQTQKAIATFWACRRMFGQTWGLKPKMVGWIYKAILVPQLAFASVVWWPALRKATYVKHINKIFRLVVLGITGALRTSPTLAVGCLLNLEPPHILAEAGARRTALRLKSNGLWRNSHIGHAAIFRQAGDLDWIAGRRMDRCPPRPEFEPRFKVLFPDRLDWLENSRNLFSPQGLVWYVDGAKSRHGTGIGIWSNGPKTELSQTLGPLVSTFQAEIFAILTCARLALGKAYRGKHIYICSDSKAALKSLQQMVARSRLVCECREILKELAQANFVKLLWVPGHCGILGNEKADRLARQGAQPDSIPHDTSIGIAGELIKRAIDDWSHNRLVSLWRESSGMAHTKAFLAEPLTSLGNALIGLCRRKLRVIVGLITGHWYTRAHLKNMRLVDNSTCLRCNAEEETPLHLIKDCIGLREARLAILGACSLSCTDIAGIELGSLLLFAQEAGLTKYPAV